MLSGSFSPRSRKQLQNAGKRIVKPESIVIYSYFLQNLKKLRTSIKNYKVIIVEVTKVQNASCCAVPFIPERDYKSDDSGTCTLDGVLRTYNTASAMSLGFKLGNLLNSSSGSND